MKKWMVVTVFIALWIVAQYVAVVMVGDIWLALAVMLGGLIALPVLMYLMQNRSSSK
ncbi:MAG: hypothetical protein R8K22_07700 [Mariprofundaceae bacterium]